MITATVHWRHPRRRHWADGVKGASCNDENRVPRDADRNRQQAGDGDRWQTSHRPVLWGKVHNRYFITQCVDVTAAHLDGRTDTSSRPAGQSGEREHLRRGQWLGPCEAAPLRTDVSVGRGRRAAMDKADRLRASLVLQPDRRCLMPNFTHRHVLVCLVFAGSHLSAMERP
jgi:hypothetical protein